MGRSGKNRVIEKYDVAVAAIVRIQRFRLNAKSFHFIFNAIQDFPVTAAKAIDALLDIAYQHTRVAGRHILHQQTLEIDPLQRGGVLKFIYHYVAEGCANPFKHKRGIVSTDQFVEKQRGLCQQESVILGVNFGDIPADFAHQSQWIDVF